MLLWLRHLAQPSLSLLLWLTLAFASQLHSLTFVQGSFCCFLPMFLISLGPFCVNFQCLLELTAPPNIASSAKFINVQFTPSFQVINEGIK